MSWLEINTENRITQGSVVDNVPWGFSPAPLGIVLSNPCDLEWGKASYLLIASLIPAKETIQLSKEFQQQIENSQDHNLSKSKWTKISNFVLQFINNQNIVRYFFIDPTSVIDAPLLFVDFQHLITIPINYSTNIEMIAQLPSPFREKMITHFSSYISRIAVERTEVEKTNELINKIAEPYHQSP